MANDKDTCLATLQQALGDSEDARQVFEDIKLEVERRMDEEGRDFMSVYNDVLDEFIKIEEMATKRSKAALYYSSLALNKLKSQLRAFMELPNTQNRVHALSRTIEAAGNEVLAYETRMIDTFSQLLRREGVDRTFARIDKDEALQLDIMRELQQANLGDEGRIGITGNEDAVKIVNIFQKILIDSMRTRMREIGLKAENLKGRMLKQVWSRFEMLNVTKEEFISDLLPRLDLHKTFKVKDGKKPPSLKTVKRALGDFYDRMIKGEMKDVPLTPRSMLRERETYAARIAADRVFFFRTPEDELHILKKYGGESITSLMAATVRQTAKYLRTTEVFGVNPRNTLENLKRMVKREGTDEEALLIERTPVKQALVWGDPDAMLDVVTGAFDVAGSPSIRQITNTFLNLTRATLLGQVLLSAIPDLGTIGRAHARIGGSTLRGIAKAVQMKFSRMTDEEARITAGALDQAVAYTLGAMHETAAGRGVLFKIENLSHRYSNSIMKWGGIDWWTKTGKRAAYILVNGVVLKHFDKSFAELDRGLRAMLLRGGVREQDWDKLRGMEGIVVDLPHGQLIDIDKIAEDDRGLANRVFAAFKGFTDDAVPTPGVRERAIMSMGQNRGTIVGAMASIMTNLLGYPITYMTRQMGREAEAGGGYGLSGQMKLAATSLFFGYLSTIIRDIANGRTRDYFSDDLEVQAKFLRDAAARGGLGGLFGGEVLNALSFSSPIQGLLSGATAGVLDKIVEGLIATGKHTIEGEIDKAAADFAKTIRPLIPYSNLPQTKLMMDTLLYQPLIDMLDPAMLRRMRRRWERETGGQYNFLTGR